jgi:hypothetical protein
MSALDASGAVRILEVIQRCSYCGREMSTTPEGYLENPFCAVCLDERLALPHEGRPLIWRTIGGYEQASSDPETPPSGGSGLPRA